MPLRGLGWHPSVPDFRDYQLSIAKIAPAVLPPMVDIRAQMPPIGDQGQIGSCTAWASTAAYRYELDRQGLPDFDPSELAQYYWTRQLEGTTHSDAGASIRDAIKTIAKVGVVAEHLWPYHTDQGAITAAPPTAIKRQAKQHLALQYEAVQQTPNAIRIALAAGLPVVYGMAVYSSFESDPVRLSGVVPMPAKTDQALGGHALCLVGYAEASQHYTVRNSWGTDFGDHGYLYVPYEYIHSPRLASDFWVMRSVK